MKVNHFFLGILFMLTLSCGSTFEIRKGVKGYVVDDDTNLPIDNAEIGFLMGYKTGGMATEIKHQSDKKGFFEIEPLEKRTNYDAAKTLRNIHSSYLKVEKQG